MQLAQAECRNPTCRGTYFDENEDREVGHTFIVSVHPSTRYDPGFVEGHCDMCGEEMFEYEYMSDYDIEELKAEQRGEI